MVKGTYNWCDLGKTWCVDEVTLLDASNVLFKVQYFGPWLNHRVKHNVAVEVDNTDSGKSFAFRR